jgi:hypothetical protein
LGSEGFLFNVPEWVIGLALLVAMLVSLQIGRRYGEHDRRTLGEINEEAFNLSGAALGLLALLLAFTYSVASTHFDLRKSLVLKEANAIGTAWLRSDFAPEAQRRELRDLLREYVDLRVNFSASGLDATRHAAMLADTDRLQARLWNTTVRAFEGRATTQVEALAVAAMNDVFDAHAERLRAHRDHVPDVVIELLIVVALAAVGLLGSGAGRNGEPRHWLRALLPLLIVAVILLIIDLDRPREGLVQVSQAPLLDLQAMVHAAPAPAPAPANPSGK